MLMSTESVHIVMCQVLICRLNKPPSFRHAVRTTGRPSEPVPSSYATYIARQMGRPEALLKVRGDGELSHFSGLLSAADGLLSVVDGLLSAAERGCRQKTGWCR